LASADEQIHQAITKGRQFLVDLFDPTLDLLPEYRGSQTYWLFHDNYLADQVLRKSHPEIANKIDAALKREKVTSSGKIEILFGGGEYLVEGHHYELVEVRKVGDKIIKTERTTDKVNEKWNDYADLQFFAELNERFCGVYAVGCVQAGLAKWDGQGFVDPATKKDKRYATYKLALARIAAKRLGYDEKITDTFLPKLLKLQDKSGGWITDYDVTGKPIGLANVETTCLVLLALETYL
jgi:hypothetical protein